MADQEVMRAVLSDPAHPGKLTIETMPKPQASASQVRVKVKAFSLNAGDTRSALAAQQRYIPGWDFAGIIDVAAEDGTSPPVGARVFGFYASGGWAQYQCVPATNVAALPDGVTIEQAAGLPVAGITAMLALRKGGDLNGKRVLITGAAGGVGRYACQLAAYAGADLHAISRRADFPALLAADGVTDVRVFADIATARAVGDYDYILDSVGGSTLAGALGALRADGIIVNCGNSTGEPTSFDVRDFYFKDGVQLYGFYLGRLMMTNPRAALYEIAGLVAAGILKVPVGETMAWDEIGEASRRLAGQHVNGKIVLLVD